MTVPPDDGLTLAADFPQGDRERWRALAAGVLRKAGAGELSGEEAELRLATRLEDGLRTLPLYTAENAGAAPGYPGSAPFVRGGRPEGGALGGWEIRQRHVLPAPGPLNEALRTDLELGVAALWIAVGDGGVPVAELPAALDGVLLDLAPVVLDAGAQYPEAAREFLALLAARGVAPEAALGVLGADPLGVRARTGNPADLGPAVELAVRCAREYRSLRALVVDGLPFHEAGASPAQELGCSLAAGVAYLRALTDGGLSVDEALGQLEFRYAVDADQFLGIAKLRAARALWGRVAKASGASDAAGAQRQHAVTSRVMMTRRDPWVNMLRTTVAAFAAGVGGADAVTVLPFDEGLGLSDGFSRRIARNTSTILVEESHLARVIDPAGGSWYVESLTGELAAAGWRWFREIEAAGGMAAALGSGLVEERIAATWRERTRRLATRREPVTGVSEFPLLAEEPVVREPSPPVPGGGLPRVRRDDAYEALRARSDAQLAEHGQRPRVFLATLGPVAAHTARATFAANLFQAGGIEPVRPETPVDAATTAGAFAASGATVACLCGADDGYAEHAADVARALAEAGARRVYLAGRLEQRPPGVDEFVFKGGDAVATLDGALDVMGVAR
ncbi:methylmalonyl-CoA mutase [Streptomyces sp. 3MP-14]|uniref:methylmalonyl-CoA mutase n=1 Tax=Streptomyces mimosae TaxID=2586635 RepID=A0A5N5ZZJ2_9ACTN|nr:MULTISPECIES: methylmalonyl-CoA mutase family protein [Streptomyces]KAB8161352.1 methylmalonyl-CoA mutase [Streptomyces mimosae]KAB8173154.1 methylmalonyl-CoA mutase [Streptomyces sp. 3MP-14]